MIGILRRQLRAVASVWLVCQVTCLAALIPLACGGSERSPEKSVCHRAAAANHCPMRAADGTPCPMHRNAPHDRAATLGGLCSAATAVAVLLQPGLVLPSVTFDTSLVASPLRPHDTFIAVRAVHTPDAPPPRA